MYIINGGRSYFDFFWFIFGLKEGLEWVNGLVGG